MRIGSVAAALVVVALAPAASVTAPLAAQATKLKKAAATITAADVNRHIRVIADDSMMGRDTPSPGLEKTAQYVADQFKKLGLKPVEDTGWIQRYWIFPLVDFARSQVTFAGNGKKATASFATTARLFGRAPEHSTPAAVVFVAGHQTIQSLASADLSNKIVLYVPTTSTDAKVQQKVVEQLRSTSAGFVLLSNLGSAEFTRRLRLAMRQPDVRPGRQWTVSVAGEDVAGLVDVLASVGIDLTRVRSDTTPVYRDLPSLQISMDLQLDRAASDSVSAPNVVGVLEGSDSSRAGKWLVYMAHMDHAGIAHGQPDSNNNGADDNASGTAGLIELARAFTQPGARPARSIVFLATSGVKGSWGSTDFTDQIAKAARSRALMGIFSGSPNTGAGAEPVIAALNLDRIGAPDGDSVVVDGIGDAQFATPPNWAATAHPELQLAVVDGGTAVTPTSDHFAFVRRGVPSLYFHNGHDGHETADASDSPKAIDPDREARILRLAFYVGYDIANAKRTPSWTAAGRRAFLESTGQE
jgi:hypothetical protein